MRRVSNAPRANTSPISTQLRVGRAHWDRRPRGRGRWLCMCVRESGGTIEHVLVTAFMRQLIQ